MRWVILYKSTQFNLWNYARYIVEKSRIGESIIDFGRGGYDYKMSNFRPQIENLYRFMASKTKWGNWYVLFKIAASHMRKTLEKYTRLYECFCFLAEPDQLYSRPEFEGLCPNGNRLLLSVG